MPSQEVQQLLIELAADNSDNVNRLVRQLRKDGRLDELRHPLEANPAMTALSYALSKMEIFYQETSLIDISKQKIEQYHQLIGVISPFICSDIVSLEYVETLKKIFSIMVLLPFVTAEGYTLAHQMVLLNNVYFFEKLLDEGMDLARLSKVNQTPFQLALSLDQTDERIIILLIKRQAPIFDFSRGLTPDVSTVYFLQSQKNRDLLLANGRKVTENDLRYVINTKNGTIYFKELLLKFEAQQESIEARNRLPFFKWELWYLAAQQEDEILFYGDGKYYAGIAADLLAVSNEDHKNMLLRQSMSHGHYSWIKLCEDHGAEVSSHIFPAVCQNIVDKTNYSLYSLLLFVKQRPGELRWKSVINIGVVACRAAKEGITSIVRSVFDYYLASQNQEAAIKIMSEMVDSEGNNLLFLSILSKNILLIKYLHLQGFHLDQAYNAKGRTAIDVLIDNELEQGARLSEKSNIKEILTYLSKTDARFGEAAEKHQISEADIREGNIFPSDEPCQVSPVCFSEQAAQTDEPCQVSPVCFSEQAAQIVASHNQASFFTFEGPLLAASSLHSGPQ